MSPEIPRALQVLWGAKSRSTRGPQRALSLDRIVAAAVEIADRDGLAALSMARLAQEFGSAPMSLYRHVANKHDLLLYMQDAAPGPPPELPAGWRAGLEAWAWALHKVYLAHPWVLQVAAGHPPLDPGQLAWLDRGLGALAGTGLTVRQRFDAVLTVLDFVRGDAQIMAVLLRGQSDVAAGDYPALITGFVTAARFPALAAAIEEGLFDPDSDDVDGLRTFRFGLARILDGCQYSMDRVGSPNG